MPHIDHKYLFNKINESFHLMFHKIAIIGALPAGLAAGYQLTKKGYTVEVYEADE